MWIITIQFNFLSQKFPFKVFLTIFFKSFHSPRFIFFLFFVCFCNNYCIINHILTNWISFFLFFIPFFFSIFFSIFFLCFCCCCCCYSIFPWHAVSTAVRLSSKDFYWLLFHFIFWQYFFILFFFLLFRLFYIFFILFTFLIVPLVMCFPYSTRRKHEKNTKNYKTTEKTNPLRIHGNKCDAGQEVSPSKR